MIKDLTKKQIQECLQKARKMTAKQRLELRKQLRILHKEGKIFLIESDDKFYEGY